MKSSIVFLLFLGLLMLLHPYYANGAEDICMHIDYVEKNEDLYAIPCSNNTLCQRNFTMTYIHIPPYVHQITNGTFWGIDEILLKCCGHCVQYSYTVLKNITELTVDMVRNSDVVFPVLGTSSTKKLHGHYYLPIIGLPSVVYVTRTDSDLLKSLLGCYPIVVFCVLLSMVAGFVAWILETWSNQGEFPRPFLIGCFEGFWWSFVSMTTVGYGDKTPKSMAARLFSIVWIMIGVITFGLLTGQLTGEIMKANSPPAPSIKEKYVGVLRYRDHDAYAIIRHGGMVVRNADAHDFDSDVLQLIMKLKKHDIDGFVVDKWTLAYISIFSAQRMPGDALRFLIEETTRTEKMFDGEELFYGMLLNKEDFSFFEEYVRGSQHRWAILSEEWMVQAKNHHGKSGEVYSAQAYFKRTIICIGIMLALTLVFGAVYEVKRRGKSDIRML